MNSITESEHEKRMSLYRMGLNDREISECVYICDRGIHHWRTQNGLPANKKRGVISMQAYEFLREMAGKNELCKEILQAVKPRMEDL